MWALIQGMKCETSVKTPGIPEHVPVPQETTPTMSKAAGEFHDQGDNVIK
jgi:hypothetical protein